MQLLRFRQLRALMVLQDSTSIAVAAARFGVSQPAMTKLLREVEGSVGQSLFVRTNRGIGPTEAGEVLCRHARHLLAGLRETAEDLHALDGGLRGTVVVGAMLTAASVLVPAAITQLKQTLPGVTVTVLEGTNERHLPGLLAGEIDMVVGRVPEPAYADRLVQELLFEERIRLFVRAGHPLAGRSGLSLAELIHHPWVLPPQQTALRRQVEDGFLREGLGAPKDLVESVSLLIIRSLLMRSDRIAVLPEHVLDLELRAGLVRPLPLEVPATNSRVGILQRRDGATTPAAAAFLEILRAEATRLDQL